MTSLATGSPEARRGEDWCSAPWPPLVVTIKSSQHITRNGQGESMDEALAKQPSTCKMRGFFCLTHRTDHGKRMNADKILARTRKDGDCLIWTGSVNRGGYALVDRAPARAAHKALWIYIRGPLEKGMTLDHLCGRPSCVNLDHLEPMSLNENILRGRTSFSAVNARKVRCPKGHPLSPDNIRKRRDHPPVSGPAPPHAAVSVGGVRLMSGIGWAALAEAWLEDEALVTLNPDALACWLPSVRRSTLGAALKQARRRPGTVIVTWKGV